MVLWPGAGSGRDHAGLVAIEEALAPLPVHRVDFPYRREGRRAPDRAVKLVAAVRAEVAAIAEEMGTTTDRLVVGGRSMGGRMCSMAAAGATGATARGAPRTEEPLRVAGVVLVAYPLHPPGRPEKLRTEHLVDLQVPTLWVSGDRDPFGTPDELAAARELVPGPVTAVAVPGARHELAGADDQVARAVADWVGRG